MAAPPMPVPAVPGAPLHGPASGRSERDILKPVPPPIAPGHARLSSVGEAISASRMDVLLQPVVGLADHQVHHHEVTVSLRDDRGTILPLAANDRQLPRTGLLPLLDSARLRRAAQVAKSFADDGHRQCIFVTASAESLSADRFLDELAAIFRQRQAVAGEIVLTFSQSDIRTFGTMEWSALADMRDLGFRFCADGVTDLDYEFTALKAAGFSFVKIDAANLLRGLAGPRGAVPGVDVCRSLGEIGLAVIVGAISDETTRAAVVECGVPLGQGPFFGAPAGWGSGSMSTPGTAAA
jgi:cyclic-di-GMP phosphodiesterase TipF (flagellum assembly factor)